MKSLEEALAVVAALIKNDSDAPAKLSDYQDNLHRYQDLVDDITSNKIVNTLMQVFRSLNQKGELDGDAMLMTTFINGVIVGIEMTKVDWVPPDPAPRHCRDCGGITSHETTCPRRSNSAPEEW